MLIRFDGPFFVPGVGKRLRPGSMSSGSFFALACEGPDSGDEDEPLGDTPIDEEPCDVSVDTKQNPECARRPPGGSDGSVGRSPPARRDG